MIVTKKILIAAAIIPIIIALAIAIPKLSPSGGQTTTTPSLLRIEFSKEDMKRISYGVTERIGALKSERLTIDEKGQAFYNINTEGEKGSQTRFQVNSQDLKRLKALIIDTGFMQIPKSEFAVKDDANEFTKYTLKVSLDGHTKTVNWVDESASQDFVPPLVLRLSDTIRAIVDKNT
ncbi:MAG: hypothetical protein QXU32_03195 [Nitrososphaerales archaeon]